MYSHEHILSAVYNRLVVSVSERHKLCYRSFCNSVTLNKYFDVRKRAACSSINIRNDKSYTLNIIIICIKQPLCKQRAMRISSMTYDTVSVRNSTIAATRLQSAPRILEVIVYEHMSKTFIQRRSTLLDTTGKRFFCYV